MPELFNQYLPVIIVALHATSNQPEPVGTITQTFFSSLSNIGQRVIPLRPIIQLSGVTAQERQLQETILTQIILFVLSELS